MGKLKYYAKDSDELKQLDEAAKDGQGYWYCLEWDDCYKIGLSTKPYQRLNSFKTTARYFGIQLGDFYVSIPHYNYVENEAKLHEIFKSRQKENTELFKVGLPEILVEAERLEYVLDKEDTEMPLFLKTLMNQLARGVGIKEPWPDVKDWEGFEFIESNQVTFEDFIDKQDYE